MKIASFFDLVAAMKSRQAVYMQGPRSCFYPVNVNSIQLEDGSGRRWNVGTISVNLQYSETVFWDEDKTPKFFLNK